jgi:hypothetical protein
MNTKAIKLKVISLRCMVKLNVMIAFPLKLSSDYIMMEPTRYNQQLGYRLWVPGQKLFG